MTMDKFAECFRGFSQHSRTCYAKNVPLPKDIADEVMLGYYHPEGGTVGEMKVEWVELGSRRKPSPHLCIFDDAWALLGKCPDLLAELVPLDGSDIQPADFCALLVRLGFRDMTNTENSNPETPPCFRLVPVGAPCELEELDDGSFFLCGETVALKSEYQLSSGAIQAIIHDSGEFFWGGAKTPEEQRKVIVQPMKLVPES